MFRLERPNSPRLTKAQKRPGLKSRSPSRIAAGKAFSMQSKYVDKKYLLLTRIWSSPGAFADLSCSILDAAEFFRAEEKNSTEKLFWS